MKTTINASFGRTGEAIFTGPYLVWDSLGNLGCAICTNLDDAESHFLPDDVRAEYDEPVSLDDDADATGICVYDVDAEGDFDSLVRVIQEDVSILYPLNTIEDFGGDITKAINLM